MKRFISIMVLFCMLIISFTGCANTQNTVKNASSSEQTNGKKLSIVTTIFPQYDFVKQIAGDKVDITLLLPPGAESHSYEPSPQDIIKIQKSDLFIFVGGESDSWIEDILSSAQEKSPKQLKLIDCVNVVDEVIVEGMQGEEHEHEEEHKNTSSNPTTEPKHEEGEHEIDEHVWTSPKNAVLIANKITDELSALDATNSAIYKQNAASYVEKLTKLDAEFKAVVEKASNKTMVFGDRFPFRYFADEYGLKYFAAFPGCSTDTEPSAATVAFLIDKVKSEKISTVFYIEFSNAKVTDAICDATGAKKAMFHSCHNVTKSELTTGVSYIDLMTKNLEVLKEALK